MICLSRGERRMIHAMTAAAAIAVAALAAVVVWMPELPRTALAATREPVDARPGSANMAEAP